MGVIRSFTGRAGGDSFSPISLHENHHMTSPTKKKKAFLPSDTSSLGMRTFLKLFVDLPGFGRCGALVMMQSPWLGISRKRIYTTWKGSMASG